METTDTVALERKRPHTRQYPEKPLRDADPDPEEGVNGRRIPARSKTVVKAGPTLWQNPTGAERPMGKDGIRRGKWRGRGKETKTEGGQRGVERHRGIKEGWGKRGGKGGGGEGGWGKRKESVRKRGRDWKRRGKGHRR